MKNYHSIDGGEEAAVPAPQHDLAVDPVAAKDDHPHDRLVPPFDSPDRPSSLLVGTFNLVATVVGGGVLSLPVVFERCGVAFATFGMILSACMTYASLWLMCLCGRRGGGSSYGEVVRGAFGERAEEAVSWLLFLFLWFVIVAYMILIRDIWTPLARQVAGSDDVVGDRVLLAITALLLPLLFQRSLHALRWNCYIGSASIFVLCIALCRGGWQNMAGDDDEEKGGFEMDIFKVPSPSDVLFSFPIMALTFMCAFNVISIQNALCEPTRRRMQSLTRYAIGISFALMYTFGLGGYLYAGPSTRGNVLLNVPTARQDVEDDFEYWLFLLGRIGCGTTITLATPIVALPCRESLLEVLDVWFHRSHHVSDVAAAEGEKCCWGMFHRWNPSETDRDATITTEDEVIEMLPEVPEGSDDDEGRPRSSSFLVRHDPIQKDYVFRNALGHYGTTLLIMSTCYLAAVAVSGSVAVVWSFIGSSMAFLIAFVLPCGCFVVIEAGVPAREEGGDRKDGWIRVAWVILAFSIVGAVVCTINNLMDLWR